MASTITTNELSGVLNDYKLHLTGYDKTGDSNTPSSSSAYVDSPPDWPTDRHRVPPFRPLNRNLDMEERPKGMNGGEYVFLTIMFTGVWLNSAMAKVWGKTGGPFAPGLFRYAIGGEW